MSDIYTALDCIIIEPNGRSTNELKRKTRSDSESHRVTHSVIWLHGLGARGQDFAKLVPKLKLPKGHGIRFIFPTAPERAITLREGKVATAWYDIMKVSPGRIINMQQLDEAVGWIQKLIEAEIDSGIDSKNITLIGFSQGGAVTYEAAMGFPLPLKQLISLSTYLPRSHKFHPQNLRLPIHIFHGDKDTMVPYYLGTDAYKELKEADANVRFYTFPIRHEVSRDLLNDLTSLLLD